MFGAVKNDPQDATLLCTLGSKPTNRYNSRQRGEIFQMPCLTRNNSGSSGLSFNPWALHLLCSASKTAGQSCARQCLEGLEIEAWAS